MIKALLIVICLASSSASSSCLLGDGERGVELICPEYSGTGATLCCGHSVNRSAESWCGENVKLLNSCYQQTGTAALKMNLKRRSKQIS